MRRWLLIAALLLALALCLEAGQRPRRGRHYRLNRKAHSVAGQVRRLQLKQRRRGEAVSNEVTVVAKGSSQAKEKPLQGKYRTKAKQSQRTNKSKASRPTRGRKQRKGASKRRMVHAKDICLFRALRRCGKRALKKLQAVPEFAKRCREKDRFLDCMWQSQQRGCKVRKRRRRRGPSRRLIQQYQRRLQKALIKARGCVIGVDLSAATPLTDR